MTMRVYLHIKAPRAHYYLGLMRLLSIPITLAKVLKQKAQAIYLKLPELFVFSLP